MAVKRTPGPWEYTGGSACVVHKEAEAPYTHYVARYVDPWNATLIAAAPELADSHAALLEEVKGDREAAIAALTVPNRDGTDRVLAEEEMDPDDVAYIRRLDALIETARELQARINGEVEA